MSHSPGVIGDENDITWAHLLRRNRLHVVPPQLVLCGIINDVRTNAKSQIRNHLSVSPNDKSRAVELVRPLATPNIRIADLLERYLEGIRCLRLRNGSLPHLVDAGCGNEEKRKSNPLFKSLLE